MRVVARLRSAVHASFRTRRRAQLSILLILALGVSCWYGVRLTRAHFAFTAAEKAIARYDFPAARDQLKLAGQLRPQKPAVWLLAAQAARRDGDFVEAKGHLTRYESLAGALTPEGRLEQSLQLTQQGEIERDVYDLMAKVDAGHPATEQILEALAVGAVHVYHFDKAAFWVHHLMTRFPKNPIGRLIRAQMDDVLGKRDRAAVLCREILADFPGHWKAKLLLAGLLYRDQRYAEAAEFYGQLHQQLPNDLRSLLGLARCQERLGRKEEAAPLMRVMEERFPDNGDAMLECGRFALTDDRVVDAERLLRRALQLAPSDHEVHYNLGLCLERLGRADEARQHFERFKQIEADLKRLDQLFQAVVKDPRDPIPRREAGLICLRNGQNAEGLRWLQGALAIAPGDKLTQEALSDYYRTHGQPGGH